MMKGVHLKIGERDLRVNLYPTGAAEHIEAVLPATVSMARWGDEYYGNCHIATEIEQGARQDMEIGEIALWPEGNALCIFFGPTPASRGEEPRAISPVNPVGRIDGEPEEVASFFRALPDSITVHLFSEQDT